MRHLEIQEHQSNRCNRTSLALGLFYRIFNNLNGAIDRGLSVVEELATASYV
jgi:hypothetical protein